MGNEFISIEIGTDPGTIDLFIPKQERRLIYLGNALKSASFQKYASKAILPIVLGENTSGELMSICLTEIVHLLVAGATGSGKSVFLHNIITSLLLNVNPDLLRMILIDPKANEMLTYNGIPHVNVITDMNQSFKTLESLCIEMDKRYELLGKHGYRNIKQYNNNSEKKLSYIVCVIDEYADLMMTNSEVEDYIVRLAQKARASGIHLIIATQKPLATVVTSLLKTNLPSAIGFKMKTSQDYMTVFGKGIPYRLFGKGDGVAMIEGQLKEFERFQSPLITADENEEIGVFNKLRESFGNMKIASEPAVPEIVKEEEPIDKLRKIIATTGETRVTKLRELMGIRINVVQELIQQLASEGFLKKENNKYEVTATEEELNNYRNEEYDK
nr:FtsK/SpoIIIE domain-containing protein [Lederbergia lenta]